MSDTPETTPEGAPLRVEDLNRFEVLLDEAIEQMAALTDRLDAIKVKAEVAERTAIRAKKTAAIGRKLLRTAVVVSAIAIALTIGAVVAVARNQRAIDSNQRAIDNIEAIRDESRRVTCVSHNAMLDAIELKVVTSGVNAIRALAPVGAPLTPEQEARLAAYVMALEADQSLAPLRRDCTSKAAIDAWYEGDGPGSTPAVTSPPSTNRQEIP